MYGSPSTLVYDQKKMSLPITVGPKKIALFENQKFNFGIMKSHYLNYSAIRGPTVAIKLRRFELHFFLYRH